MQSPKVRAIVSSIYSNDVSVYDYQEEGGLGAIPKPYQIESMSDALRHVLEK
jgi:hypothetical protein